MKTTKYIFLILITLLHYKVEAQHIWAEIITPDSVELYTFTFDTVGNLYIGTNKGVYFSNNYYQWQYLGPDDFVSYIFINDNNTIYAGMNELYRSNDNGLTWDSIFYYSQGGITSIYTIGDSIICVGTWGGIYRSADGGQTWHNVLFAYNSEVFKAIVANNEGVLFAGSTNFTGDYSPGGVYRSDDNGETWILTGLDYYFISAMVVDSEDRIYACARGNYITGKLAVFKSLDNGVSWEIVYENNPVNTITNNGYDEIAIGCDTQDGHNGGIFCSYSEGETWEEITNNLPSNSIYQVVFSPDNYLYTITHSGTKLFKTETPVDNSDKFFDKKSNAISTFPNPAKNKIQFKVTNSLSYNVRISNLQGHVVLNEIIYPEENFIRIDIQKLKPGTYLVHCSDKESHKATLKFIKY